MALVLKDRVQETTTTTGTGTLTLGGAVTGYQAFSVVGNGNVTYYAIYAPGGSDWEVGVGTYTASGTTLSRDTVLASSNSGSLVSFGAGTKNVWCDYPAGKAIYTDTSGSISEPIVNISNISGSISTVDTVTFDTAYTTALTAGQLGWDGNNTLGIGMAGGNVIQRIGEDTYIYAKASSAITKGQLCMFTGVVGASSVITAAPSTGVTSGQYIIGLAAESIALNAFGLIQVTGSLKGFDTSAYTDGDVLYYNSAVTGGLTATYPTSGLIVTVAAVTNAASGSAGSVQIRVSVTQRINASTGISVSQTGAGSTITNTAPDQTVSLTAGTGISTSGTYPNFTITNTAPSSGGTVTSVTATSPVTSTGGTTPVIAMPAATTSVSGYLTSTDWNTFNSKGSGTVTSVTGTAPVVSSGGATPAISMAAATTSVSGYLTSTDWNTFNNKQATLVSGSNIKTINTNSILGSGDLTVSASPAGSNTQVQYNNSGALGASSAFTYASSALTAPNLVASNGLVSNNNTVSASFTVPSGSSVMSVGPITVAAGQSVTVPAGGRWVVL